MAVSRNSFVCLYSHFERLNTYELLIFKMRYSPTYTQKVFDPFSIAFKIRLFYDPHLHVHREFTVLQRCAKIRKW